LSSSLGLTRAALAVRSNSRARSRQSGGEALGPAALESPLGPEDLLALQERAERVHASPALLDYLLDLLARSRDGSQNGFPLSPRAGLGLLAAARSWALIAGRDHVLPDDVQAVLPAVCEHRLDGGQPGDGGQELSRQLLAGVDNLR
jgi:MoxR-like ATPase